MKTRQMIVFGFMGLVCLIGAGCSESSIMYARVAEDCDKRVLVKYNQTPCLDESLFPEDAKLIGNEAVATILDSRIVLPEHARIAVLLFGDQDRWNWYSERISEKHQIAMDNFFERLKTHEQIDTVRFLPSMMTPSRPTIPQLREAAARFQADLMLVINLSNFSWSIEKFLAEDELKTNCYVETILLDTRTGIIPFSARKIATAQGRKTRNDFNAHEAQLRIEIEASQKALDAIAEKFDEFLTKR